MRRLILLAATALVAGCVARHQPPADGIPAEQLIEAVTRARVAASSGRHNEADAILARFAEANPATPEAREAAYWRAILGLESARSRADRDAAKKHLNTYLADTTMTAHRVEAGILRQLLSVVESTAQATDSATAAARQAAAAREEELKKEIQSLKEQLDKTNEELTRIRRRLGSRP